MSDCKKCLCLSACQEHYTVSESRGIRNYDQCKCFINKDEYVKVARGRWVLDNYTHRYRCSICQAYQPYDTVGDYIDYWDCDYCPGCGAKMDLKVKQNEKVL